MRSAVLLCTLSIFKIMGSYILLNIASEGFIAVGLFYLFLVPSWLPVPGRNNVGLYCSARFSVGILLKHRSADKSGVG
jgi:hypothetical protein